MNILSSKMSSHIPQILNKGSKSTNKTKKNIFLILRKFQQYLNLFQNQRYVQSRLNQTQSNLIEYQFKVKQFLKLNINEKQQDQNIVLFFIYYLLENLTFGTKQIEQTINFLNSEYSLLENLDNWGYIIGKLIENKNKINKNQKPKQLKLSKLIDNYILISKIDRFKADYSKYYKFYLLQLTYGFILNNYDKKLSENCVENWQNDIKKFYQDKQMEFIKINKQFNFTQYQITKVLEQLTYFMNDTKKQILNSLIAYYFLIKYLIKDVKHGQTLSKIIIQTINITMFKILFCLYDAKISYFNILISIIDELIELKIFQKIKHYVILHFMNICTLQFKQNYLNENEVLNLNNFIIQLGKKYTQRNFETKNCSNFIAKSSQYSQFLKFLSQNNSFDIQSNQLLNSINENSINYNKKSQSNSNKPKNQIISTISIKKHLIYYKSKLTDQFLKCLEQYKYHQICMGLQFLKKKSQQQKYFIKNQIENPAKKIILKQIQTLYISILLKILFQISNPNNYLKNNNYLGQILSKQIQRKIFQLLSSSDNIQVDFKQIYQKIYYDTNHKKILKFNFKSQDFGVKKILDYSQKRIFEQNYQYIYYIFSLKQIFRKPEYQLQDRKFIQKILQNKPNNYIAPKIQQFFDSYLSYFNITNKKKQLDIFRCLLQIINNQTILIQILANILYNALKSTQQKLIAQIFKLLKVLFQIFFIIKTKQIQISQQALKQIFLIHQKLKQLDLQNDSKILNQGYIQSIQPTKKKYTQNNITQYNKPVYSYFNHFFIENPNFQQRLIYAKKFYQLQKYRQSILVLQHLKHDIIEKQLKGQIINHKVIIINEIAQILSQSYAILNNKFAQKKQNILQKFKFKQEITRNHQLYINSNLKKNVLFNHKIKKSIKKNKNQISFLSQIFQIIFNNHPHYKKSSLTINVLQSKIIQYCENNHFPKNVNEVKRIFFNITYSYMIKQIYKLLNNLSHNHHNNKEIKVLFQNIEQKVEYCSKNLHQLQLNTDRQQIVRYLAYTISQKNKFNQYLNQKHYDFSTIKRYYEILIEKQNNDLIIDYLKYIYGQNLIFQNLKLIDLEILLKYYFKKNFYQVVILINEIIKKKKTGQIREINYLYISEFKPLLNQPQNLYYTLIASIATIPNYPLTQFYKFFEQIIYTQTNIIVNSQLISHKDLNNQQFVFDLKQNNQKLFIQIIEQLQKKVKNYFKLLRVIYNRIENTKQKYNWLYLFEYLHQLWLKINIKLLSTNIKKDFIYYYLRFLFQKIQINELQEKLLNGNQFQSIKVFLKQNVKYLKYYSIYVLKHLQTNQKSNKNKIIKQIIFLIIKSNTLQSCWLLYFIKKYDFKKQKDQKRQQEYKRKNKYLINNQLNQIYKKLFQQIKIYLHNENLQKYMQLQQFLLQLICFNKSKKNQDHNRKLLQKINNFNINYKQKKYKIPLIQDSNLIIKQIGLAQFIASGQSCPVKIQFICINKQQQEDQDKFSSQNSKKSKSSQKNSKNEIKKTFILKYNYNNSLDVSYRIQADSANFYKAIDVLDQQVTYNIYHLTKHIVLIQSISKNHKSLKNLIVSSNEINKKRNQKLNVIRNRFLFENQNQTKNVSNILVDQLRKNPLQKISLFQYYFFDDLKSDFDFIRWWDKLNNYIRTLAYWSYIGYITRLGDRHRENILILNTGHIVHIDFQYNFGKGLLLPCKQLVPFRLNNLLITPLGMFKQKGLFEIYFLQAIEKYQKNQQSVWKALGIFTEAQRQCIRQFSNLKNRFDTIQQGVQKLIQLSLDYNLLRQMFHGWEPWA